MLHDITKPLANKLQRAAGGHEASPGVAADGLLDFSKETCEKIVVFSAKVEQCCDWPVQASVCVVLMRFRSGLRCFPRGRAGHRNVADPQSKRPGLHRPGVS